MKAEKKSGYLEYRSKLTDHLYVVFKFGRVAYHVDEDLERVVAVYPTARFEFESSKYTRRYVMETICERPRPKGDPGRDIRESL